MSLTVSLLVNVAVVLAFLWFVHKDRDATAKVLAQFSKEAHEREQALLQRIQAPEAAVLQHEQDTRPATQDAPWLGWETDDLEDRLTKEQLAEAIDGRND